MKVLVTAPPMLVAIDTFRPLMKDRGFEVIAPTVIQTMPENELVRIVPQVDGWIAGDCPVNERVMASGLTGRLRAIVKWGVGVDNVDFGAAARLGLAVRNTPGVFGAEVADVALGYTIGLARETYFIDREVRAGRWPKPAGISLHGRTTALVGYGDIGRAIAARLDACEMLLNVYDPRATGPLAVGVLRTWPDRLQDADFLVLACALTKENHHLVNAAALAHCKPGVRIVNVSRGPLIDEAALIAALESGHVHSAALDVFEIEPLPAASPLRQHGRCIFGSHNGSNTSDAVVRATHRAIDILTDLLKAASVAC
jgi:D-3-phosphoglycerate dehydrogenase